MKIKFVHDFNENSEKEFSEIQKKLTKNIILKNSFCIDNKNMCWCRPCILDEG